MLPDLMDLTVTLMMTFLSKLLAYKSAQGEAQSSVRALQTVFRLRHVMTGHYVFSSAVSPQIGALNNKRSLLLHKVTDH